MRQDTEISYRKQTVDKNRGITSKGSWREIEKLAGMREEPSLGSPFSHRVLTETKLRNNDDAYICSRVSFLMSSDPLALEKSRRKRARRNDNYTTEK